MGRFRDSIDDDGNDSGIDISPLIDCVFILLIFFIVTTVFVEETGVEVEKPESTAAQDLEKQSILIAVTNKNEVIYDQRNIGVEGVLELVRRLNRTDHLPVIVQADTKSDAGTLVRVIGEAKLGGATKVSIAAKASAQ